MGETMDSTELIRKFLSDRTGAEPAKVVEDALLSDLGVDSLMLAELMFEAEDRLGITIDLEPNQAMPQTVGEMKKIIDDLLAAKTPAA
jgi:acyl carrier protein